MDQLQPTADLLNLVFAYDPPIGIDQLSWYYRDNPEGFASIGRVDKVGLQVGNYSLVPTRLESRTQGELRLGLGVDLATHPQYRGAGTFRRTVEDSYRSGSANGLQGILGVANAQSAPRMVEAMGWRLLPHISARFLVPGVRPPTASSYLVDQQFLEGPVLETSLPTPTRPPVTGYGTRWTAELLRWRLSRPGANYVLHVHEDVVFVSTSTRLGPFRVAILLKVLPRHTDKKRTVRASSRSLATTLARQHRTPLVLHWGTTPHLRGSGIALPKRFMPSPLELVVYAFTNDGLPHFDQDALNISAFEFLDFDAY